MSGKVTSLITGSNAKIKINGVTLAYAVDVQYDISVATIPVETMGRYEVLANEPISTTVTGSFTVVRYTAAAKAGNITGAAANGNGVGNWKETGKQNPVSQHFDPASILTAQTVDVEIYRKKKSNNTALGANDVELFKKIRDVRVTRMAGSVNKRGILMETFQFVAELIDDDSFTSAPSGEPDLS